MIVPANETLYRRRIPLPDRTRLCYSSRRSANLLTLTEIAQKWGFYDDSSFNSAFRKVYRYPPATSAAARIEGKYSKIDK